MIAIICGIVAVVLIISVVVIIVIMKKRINKPMKEGIKQETTEIKTISTKETNITKDNSEDDLNFWL